MRFFSLERCPPAWGDYGDILHHGMAWRDEKDCLLRLERTGPLVSSITLPGISNIVVTDSFRADLETSNLTGISYRPLIKHQIVNLDWSDWTSEEPGFYPESGEPEAYIYDEPHSPEAADQMPVLWELVVDETAHVQRTEDPSADFGVVLNLKEETWNGDDFFRAPEVGFTFVSERAKTWLEAHAKNLVDFVEW